MKTTKYNPSDLEVAFARALAALKGQLEQQLAGQTITHIDNHIEKDNPLVRFMLKDTDGDAHELVIKVIQKPDQ